MSEVVKVGMADWKTSGHPGVLTTLGLGSCVGICLFDPRRKIIGMAHIMLPSSEAVRANANRAKFADTCLPDLIAGMQALGADTRSLVAKLAGGAQMFAYTASSDIIRVGARNVEATRDWLGRMKIPILADDTGGTYGRTIEFHSDDGRLMVKTIGHGVKWL
jgi:chemotaxis protein CheD